jgi:hypothetical protein
MMSSVTRTRRFCAIMMRNVLCVWCLDYIMHNDDMQVIHSHVHLVHNPRPNLVHLVHNVRRDLHNHLCMYSRDRSRRT